MKIRNLAIVCLMAVFVIYSGVAVFASVYPTVNTKEGMSLGLTLLSKNPATRPGLIALGDPINDPRPH